MSSNLPSLPVKRQMTLGSWAPSTQTPQLVQCNDNAHVTKLDFQVIRYNADYPDPYPAGLRIHCSSGGGGTARVPQTINWRTTTPNITTVPGVDSPDGIRDLIGSGDTYVQLLGYSTVVVGHAGSTLWQQQVQQSQVKSEFAGCKLVSVEAIYVQWLDGARFHFACPDASSSSAAGEPACGSAASTTTTAVSPFSAVPLLIGMAIGCLAAVLVGLVALALIRRRPSQQQLYAASDQPLPSSRLIQDNDNDGPPANPHTAVPSPAASPRVPPHFAQAPFQEGASTTPSASNQGSSRPASLSIQPPLMYMVQQPPMASKKQVQTMQVVPPPGSAGPQGRMVSLSAAEDHELILP